VATPRAKFVAGFSFCKKQPLKRASMRRFLILTAGILGVGLSHDHAEAGPVTDVRFVSGIESALFRWRPDLPWHKVEARSAVGEGAEITCEQTCRVKVDADNVLTLAPGTIIMVGAFFYAPLVPSVPPAPSQLIPGHEIKMSQGHIEAVSPSERAIPLVISGPGTTHVALRGAEVQVAVKGDRMVAQVNEGSARAGSNKRWITVEKAQATTLTAQGYPTTPREEAKAPEWKTSEGCTPALGVVEPGNAANVGVCWEPRPRAASYVIELARDEAFSTIELRETTSSSTWSKSLPEGRYFVRTRTIDDDMLASRTSPVRKLGVVSFTLPPGASANLAHHTVVLPQGRAFELRDASGLETALDRGIFVTIRGPIVMDGEPSHQLRFRLVGDPASEGRLELVRRALRADIEIGPKWARWPAHPVDITVTMRDPAGLVDAAQVTPKLRVMLGLTELPVAWSHRGPVWTARLAPRNVGPTVVRVLAEDEFGNQLGRHFLEVDETPPKPGETTSPARRVAHN
jgi:hypothetical protein